MTIVIPIKNIFKIIKNKIIFFKVILFKSDAKSLFLLRPKIEYNNLFRNILYYVKYYKYN